MKFIEYTMYVIAVILGITSIDIAVLASLYDKHSLYFPGSMLALFAAVFGLVGLIMTSLNQK